MKYGLLLICLLQAPIPATPSVSQAVSGTPSALELSLRCNGVETTAQSRTVKSAAYGFGNPTHPDDDEFTKHVDRVVLIELHGATGNVHLPAAVLAVVHPPIAEGWFPLSAVESTPDAITAKLQLNKTSQSLRIDRRTGAAELLGYGSQPLKGICRLDTKPRQF